MNWAVAVDFWARHLEGRRAAATVEGYLKHVRWLAVAMPNVDPADVTPAQLDRWIGGQSWSRHTRAKVLVSLRAFYAFAIDQGWCRRSPVAGIAVERRAPGPQPRPTREVAWQQALGDYLVWLRAGGRCAGTVKIRRWHMTDLSGLHADPWQVTTDDLALWLSRPDLSPEYRRALRGSARSFYRWALQSGRIDHDPAVALEPVTLPRALPRPITPEALRVALGRADDRQRLILLLAAVAGLRRAEVAAVQFSDLIGDDQLLVHGKGGHQRIVPLHPDLARELQAERARRRAGGHGSGWSGPFLSPEGYLFPSALLPQALTPKHVAKVAAECIPHGWTLHTLRHRFATRAYAAQRDLRAVQELLGHAKPETTARYAAVPDGAKLAAVLGAGI